MTKRERALRIAAMSALVFGLSCRDRAPSITSPRSPTRGPTFEFVDGAHGGNVHFYFLPPLVSSPTVTGTFDPNQAPVVVVCQLASTHCSPIVAQFSMTTGTGAQVVRVAPTDQLYIVNWETDQCTTGPCTLTPGAVYRIRVLVAGTELGHADVQVVASQQEARNVNTGELFPLVDGRTVPVKFRIEVGAVFVVTPTTQTQIVQTQPNALGSSALLTVPPNAVTQSIGLTVQPAALPPATDVSALVGGTAYELGPSGTTFAAPITVAVQYAPAGIPARMAERRLRLFTLVAGAWQLVPGSVVDPVTHTVSGTTSHFSTYGVLASASVSAGSFASCGTGTSARTVCWGDNLRGEVGANSTTGPDQCSSFPCSLTPTLVVNADTFVVLSVGGGHACGVTPPPVSAAQCWGASYFGQLGNGPSGGAQLCGVAGVTDLLPCSTTAVTVSGGLSFASVSAGANHTCGVTLAGAAYCWGFNEGGQLGDNTTTGPETCSAFGETFACSTVPVAVGGGVTFAMVSAGGAHTCGVTPTGAAYCWGNNGAGQLGDNAPGGPQQCGPAAGTFPCSMTPVPVAGGLSFASVTAGASYTCGLTTANVAYCWGENFGGQLGDGTMTFAASPVAVLGGLSFTALSASASDSGHTCGVTTSGAAYCWGFGQSGELGAGPTITQSLTPVQVSGGLSFVAVSAGGFHTCGITSAPTLDSAYCWGANFQGQLGNGTTTSSSTPVQVGTLP